MKKNEGSKRITVKNTLLISGGILVGTFVGYKVGKNTAILRIARGIQKVCEETDPTLYDHMINAMTEYKLTHM